PLQMEITPGTAHVAGDLLTQSVNGWKFDLRPDALQEDDLHGCFGRQCNGMEIQQVGLNGKQFVPKSRPIADIGDGIKALAIYARLRNVYAVLRDQLFVTAQIDGRHGVLVAVTAATARRGHDRKRASQQVSRAADGACLKQFANPAAGDQFAPNPHGRIHPYFEAQFLSQLLKPLHVSLRRVPKAKVKPFMNFTRMYALRQDLLRELPGRHEREIAGERQQENGVNPGLREQIELDRY